MRLVHAADLHLGFRAYTRDTKGGDNGVANAGVDFGKNQREADVEASFRALIDGTIALAPDLVVIAGDVFHAFRPTNGTILLAFNEFSRLRHSLPNAAVVVAAGNHDLPRTRESAVILSLLTSLGIRCAEHEAKRFTFPELELSVLAVPDSLWRVRPPLTPDPAFKYNVMVLHGEAEGVKQGGAESRGNKRGADGRTNESRIPAEELRAAEWDYVALGHYHQYEQIGPNAFYSGAIDYTSSNPWQEIGVPKGFIEQDLSTGSHTFHSLPVSREYFDLNLDADGMTAAEIDDALAELVDETWIDETVTRVVVTNIQPEVVRALDYKAIKAYRRRAVHFQPVFRRPEIIRVGGFSSLVAGGRSAKPIEEMMAEILKRRLQDGALAATDLESITALSNEYLDRAKGDDPQLIPALEESIADVKAVA